MENALRNIDFFNLKDSESEKSKKQAGEKESKESKIQTNANDNENREDSLQMLLQKKKLI